MLDITEMSFLVDNINNMTRQGYIPQRSYTTMAAIVRNINKLAIGCRLIVTEYGIIVEEVAANGERQEGK